MNRDRDGLDTGTYRLRRLRCYEFGYKVPWESILARMGAEIEPSGDGRPEPREAHCQCCGGRAGYGADPEYCSVCRRAGEDNR